MMRTTVDLPDDLLDAAKGIARGRHQTLGLAQHRRARRVAFDRALAARHPDAAELVPTS